MRRSFLAVFVIAVTIAAVACSNNNASTPTTPTPPPPAPGTDSVTGQMAPGGSVIHTFDTAGVGAVNLTLTGTDPGGVLVGLGIGVPGANFSGCDMTQTVQARQGTAPQLTITVEAGKYCAGTFDVGGLGSNGVLVNFTVQHP